jgi:hypothetical protein
MQPKMKRNAEIEFNKLVKLENEIKEILGEEKLSIISMFHILILVVRSNA